MLIGVDPLLGLLAFSTLGAGAMGVFGQRAGERDASTALVMTAALGLGALCLTLNRTYATEAFGLLFGTIVGISRAQVYETALLGLLSVGAVCLLYRPLLFASVNPDLALARGIPVRRLDVVFLACVALAVSTSIPAIGSLLIFSLVVAAPAAASKLCDRPVYALALGVALNLLCCWGGIAIAYETGLPVGFLIAMLAAAVYGVASLATAFSPGSARAAK